MYTQLLPIALLSTSALATQFYSPVHDFAAMMKRGGAMQKRQGYYPSTELCGDGNTCTEACGAQYLQCPSASGIYCFDPTVGDHCCRDGTGNSCNQGYYCTTDGAENTYCCPDGMDTVGCAAVYSLTVSLIRETGTLEVPSATGGPGESSYVAATSTPIHVSSPVPDTSIYPTATATLLPTGNATYTTSSPPQFTGGAGKIAGAGMAVLAGAAGFAGIL